MMKKRKKKKLSPIQLAASGKQKNLGDNQKKKAVIADINSIYRKQQKLGMLNIVYDVNCGKEQVPVEDTFYFKEDNYKGMKYNIDRLNDLLSVFKIKLTEKQLHDVSTIESAINHLIGEEVVIKQKSGTNLKKQYKICSVINEKRE